MPRTVLETLIGLKGEARLRGVSYDAMSDTFMLDMEAFVAKDKCKIDGTTIHFLEAEEEGQNWPCIELTDQ